MLNSGQQLVAKVMGYNPLSEEEGAEPADLFACNLPNDIREGWPVVKWTGNWYNVPTMEEVEEWTFDSVCFTPDEDEVEPDDPKSWLSILGMI